MTNTSGYRTPASISPTGHYTGYIWARHGLSHPALVTHTGRVLFQLFRPIVWLAGATGAPRADSFLLTRHRLIDLRLAEAIESGRVTQVIEIAAGLAARGWRMKQRFGDRVTYIEADLPEMAQAKREALARIGPLAAGHHIVDIDALQESGPGSLAAVAAGLDRREGVAIITEGLLNYFSLDNVRSMWQHFARTLAEFERGYYWADLYLSSDLAGPGVSPFLKLLSAFVRGRVHLHFATADEVHAELEADGFPYARLLEPGEFAERLSGIPHGLAGYVKVLEARTHAGEQTSG
jgi:O-methyltransferase involved in polyketide biosynthesis